MTRKIIQIAMDSHPAAPFSLHALCDDGSVWRMEDKWLRLKPIPQDQDIPVNYPQATQTSDVP